MTWHQPQWRSAQKSVPEPHARRQVNLTLARLFADNCALRLAESGRLQHDRCIEAAMRITGMVREQRLGEG